MKIYPYAGFWKRAIAFLIDGVILSVPTVLFTGAVIGTQMVSVFKMATAGVEPTPDMMLPMMGKWMLGMAAIWLFNIVVLWLYFALMESSKKQATLGKLALGIKVVGADGGRISFARATGRTFAKFISHTILYFGDYMAGFTQKRQALHDMIATTYVVDKPFEPGNELPELPFSKGGCAAGVIAAVAPVVFYIGVILITIGLAVADLKDDPEMREMWKDLKSDSVTEESFSEASRDVLLINAKLELRELAQKHEGLTEPVTKEGVEYSQSLEGYRARVDIQGQEYELLLRPGDWDSCCAKGPNGSCGNDILYEPCK